MYCSVFNKERELTEHFRVIKDMIYDYSHLAILDIYNKLNDNGFKCIGVKTDSILYSNPSGKSIYNFFDISDKIGNYKIEEEKLCPNTPINFKINNELLDINNININNILLKDERNSEEINKIIDDKKRLLILDDYPGVGKTTLCKNYCNKNNLLIIYKFNNLCIENIKEGYNSMTLNMLLGIHLDDNKKMNKKDISKYKCIVFDEIYLYSPD